jgi:hypothetical protein
MYSYNSQNPIRVIICDDIIPICKKYEYILNHDFEIKVISSHHKTQGIIPSNIKAVISK